MNGIVLEGASATGKTSILTDLRMRLTRERPHTTLFYLSEHYTYQMLDRQAGRGEMTAEAIRQHLDLIIDSLMPYQTMLEESTFPRPHGSERAIALVERTALTHCATLDISPAPFESQFRRLGHLGLKQIILTISPAKHRQNLEWSMTERKHSRAWNRHVDMLGGPQATTEFYLKWQERLVSYAQETVGWIPTEFIDVTHCDYALVGEQLFNELVDFTNN